MQDLSSQPMELDPLEPISKQPRAHIVSTNTSESSTSSSKCYFFRLPTEIRLKIYYYALQHPHGDSDPAWLSPFKRPIIEVLPPDVRHKKDSSEVDMGIVYWGTELMTRLLRVNRQIHSEAVEVLYTKFVFDFKNDLANAAFQFLTTIPPDTAAMVRSIYVKVSIGCPEDEIVPQSWMTPRVRPSLDLHPGWIDICKAIVARLPKLRNVYVRAILWHKVILPIRMTQSQMEIAIMDILDTFSSIEHVQLLPALHACSKLNKSYAELYKAVQICQKKHADNRVSLSSMFKEIFDMDKLLGEAY
ncbi:hypothetical protein BU16DRAFT_556258 [Lophium mytilinum]|uniref:DUF7730 domain-containing protein n=1 Tax=Lophium mytilinum TaxID=390894 RepID=A0A6A6RBQ6_9PEZI|nr:hypothetical protein BU16DRAFT_556258 [Lophium mytilinum]